MTSNTTRCMARSLLWVLTECTVSGMERIVKDSDVRVSFDLLYPISYPHPTASTAAAASISTSAFNRDGTIFAYAVSYDWHKGHQGMTAGLPNKIMLHTCKEEEVKKRAAPVKR